MLESGDGSHYDALPFFPVTAAPSDEGFFSQMGSNLAAEGQGSAGTGKTYVAPPIYAYQDSQVTRAFSVGSDLWTAGDMHVGIYSQAGAPPAALGARRPLCPHPPPRSSGCGRRSPA